MIPREAEFVDILESLGRSPNTITAYINDLKTLFNKTDNITECSVQEAVIVMSNEGKKATTIRRFLSACKTYCSIFSIEINFSKIQKPKVVVREASYITDVVFAKGIGTILADTKLTDEDKRFRCTLYNFLYKTGVRIRELLTLDFKDYNIEKRYIQIIGKGNKQRKIPIHDSLLYMFVTDDIIIKMNNLHYNTVLYWTKKYFGEEFSPHSFRHGFTTKLVNKKTSRKAIQSVLGHESFVTTMRYCHMNYDEISTEVISAMEEEND